MTRLRRTLLQVATGMAAVVGLTAVRRLLRWRRRQQGEPVRLSRRERKRQRARDRAAARWALENVDMLRRFLDTSESASAHLSGWDNARRTADSFLSAAELVQGRLTAHRSDRLGSDRLGSGRAALQTKLADLQADAGPHLHAAETAAAEVARLQMSLQQQAKVLWAQAPADIAAAAKTLVAAHERARQPMDGAFDELRARRRLDELTDLRESIEIMLGDLTRSAT